MSGVGGGRTSTKGEKGKRCNSKSKLKVRCNVHGCTVTPCANNLKNRYKNNTNEEMLDRLNKAVSDIKLERLLSKADKHTKYMNKGKYSIKEKQYQNCRNHVTVQNQAQVSSDQEAEGDDDPFCCTQPQAKQRKMDSFFKVS